MELKIKINDKIKLHMEVEEEMSISEFVAISSIVTKIDKFSFNMKKDISGLRPKRESRKQMSDKEKKALIKEWQEANQSERDKIAERLGATNTQVSYRIHYYKKSLEK